MLKKHFKFITTTEKKTVYLCNWALSNPSRFAKSDRAVTCNNCKRIMKNYKIHDTEKELDGFGDKLKDFLIQGLMIEIGARLISEIARDLDPGEQEGILDQFEAIANYKEYAMKP